MREQVLSSTTATPEQPRDVRVLESERFYAFARLLMLALLAIITIQLTDEPIWPPLESTHPLMLLVWCYAGFALLVLLALVLPFLRALLRIDVFVDLAFLALVTFFEGDAGNLFYPLYIVPLVGAALRSSGSTGLVAGIIAAVSYMSASLLAIGSGVGGISTNDTRDWLGLTLWSAGLVFIPWLVRGLAERKNVANQQSVLFAEQQAAQAYSQASLYRDQMQALYEVAYTLSTTMNYQSVFDVALVQSRKLVPHACGMVLLSTGQPDELYIAASHGLSDSERGQRIQLGHGQLGEALRSANPLLIDDISREPEMLGIPTLRRCKSACLVPLRAGLKTYGTLLIASDQPNAFNQEQLGMLTALANYAIIALHNAQLIHDLQAERSKLLSKEEEVRHQLARDLHDGPAQALAAITMNIEFIKKVLDRDPERVVSELDKLATLSKRTTHEVRTMLFELRPLVLETQGLDITLRQYFERFQGNKTQIILETDGVTAELDTKSEGTLFNIIQESVNNALKHAKAEHIWVRLKQTPSTLETTIQDDGRGFDLQQVMGSYEKRGSFGLLNIDERAKLIGGMAEIHSAPGQGTSVRVIVPLPQ